MSYPKKTLRMDFEDNLDRSTVGRRPKYVEPNCFTCSYVGLKPKKKFIRCFVRDEFVELQLLR